ncbi:MAG: glycosyltransferase [Nitrosopumilus sp. D6]|nr:MAG: glycosyltransferase [Nitrosopumilus sp. D6]
MPLQSRRHYLLLFIILILSSYVHLWNPAGFPDIFFDEGVYMRRAVNVLETGNPQEAYFYDHPYWGQIVLAGFLKIAGFPDTVEQNLEMSYLVPRILMGIFAVLDTFLVYKIAEKKFGRRTAVIASVLFAVMPFTWLLRRILLDTILLPFLLSSILVAMHAKDSKNQNLLILGSALLLGLAIFTKVTAVTMIPIVGYIIYTNTRCKNNLLKWMVPVFAIPLIWPATSLLLNQLDYWFRGVFWQAGRGSGANLVVVGQLFFIDTVLMVLALASFVFAIYKRKLFLMLWFVPFLLFVSLVGYLQYFHFILILPVMCISIGFMIHTCAKRIQKNKMQNYYFMIVMAAIVIFGTVSSSTLINADLTRGQFEVLRLLVDNFNDKDTTLLSGPAYSWILSDIYKRDHVFSDYSEILFEPVRTEKTILVADMHFMDDISRGIQLQDVYDDLKYTITVDDKIEEFNTAFPYGSLAFTRQGQLIELKTNWDLSWKRP